MFRFLVRFVENFLNMLHKDDTPRADMYLPFFVCAFGVILIIIAIAALIYYFIVFQIGFLIASLGLGALGVCAIACWNNQTIEVISDEEFIYTTFLGNAYTYRFDDITALVKNSDSLTLYVGEKKVHIENCAILSDRLIDLINAQVERINAQ